MVRPQRSPRWLWVDVVCVLAFCAVGMLLRKGTSAGVAASFVVLTSLVIAVVLLGWRAAALASRRRAAA